MKRTHDVAFFECPICGKQPYVYTYDTTAAHAFCKGHGFHRHKKVHAFVPYERPGKLLKRLAQKWNQLQFEEARFLFHTNGNPFKEDATDENAKEE